MPLTPFQANLARLLAANRSVDSYLAGGAALHIDPNGLRYSNDLDYFHDSAERVSETYSADSKRLAEHGYDVEIDMSQPGYLRALVAKDRQATKVEWSHDSSWRFLPTVRSDEFGYLLHPIDLATNKVLALAGRNEVRDLVDVLDSHTRILPLGALCWAAVGKDPGFSPSSLLELLRRRGKFQQDDLRRLHLTQTLELISMKTQWLSALAEAEQFFAERDPQEVGCLFYSRRDQAFIQPEAGNRNAVPHYGRPGGVLPTVLQGP